MKEYNEEEFDNLMLNYKKVKNELLEIFEHEEEKKDHDTVTTCESIKNKFDEYGNQEAEEKYKKEIQEMPENIRTSKTSEYWMLKKKCSNTITALWSSKTNIFEWINRALFFDVLKLVFMKDETPNFLKKLSLGVIPTFLKLFLRSQQDSWPY
jgi:hypothetical protein